jgi:hypothetical protein
MFNYTNTYKYVYIDTYNFMDACIYVHIFIQINVHFHAGSIEENSKFEKGKNKPSSKSLFPKSPSKLGVFCIYFYACFLYVRTDVWMYVCIHVCVHACLYIDR